MSLLFILLIVAGVVWALLEARDAARLAASLSQQLNEERVRSARVHSELLLRISKLESTTKEMEPPAADMEPVIAQASASTAASLSKPPPLPVMARTAEPAPVAEPEMPKAPPPLPKTQSTTTEPAHKEEPTKPATPARQWNWEQFFGVQFFAWVGGLLTFLTVAFFVKLSFERGWVSNEMRIIIAYVLGIAALGGGLWLHRNERYKVLAQTLCATGALILYGGTYAAHAIYGFFSNGISFGLMALITAAAFMMAVRLEAQVIAVLGMVGGFLTPVLCSTGQDEPLALFSYIALLNAGLAAVVQRRHWHYLIALAALGTVVMELGWALKFFESGTYSEGQRTWWFIAVFAFFSAQFGTIHRLLPTSTDGRPWALGSALALACVASLVAVALTDYASVTMRPTIGFALVLAVAGVVIGMSWRSGPPQLLPAAFGMAMVHLLIWMGRTEVDKPLTLIPYLLLLHLAALWLSSRKSSQVTPLVVATGTVLVELLWCLRFFDSGRYTQGSATWVVAAVLLAFPALHLFWAGARPRLSTLILAGGALLMAFGMLAFQGVGLRPVLLYAYVFAINAMVLRVVWRDVKFQPALGLVAGATFVHLAAWTVVWMTTALLPVALGLFLVFGAMHAAFGMFWIRRHPGVRGELLSLLPLMSLGLMLLPVIKSHEVSLLIWPAFLLANLIVMIVAWMNGRLGTVLVGMALTFLASFIWMQNMPAVNTSVTRFLGVLGGLSLVFMTAASLLVRRTARLGFTSDLPAIALPASAAIMPFALLALSVTTLPMPSPSPVLGMALVLVVFLLGLVVWLREGALALVAMLSALAVQIIWHSAHFDSSRAGVAALWYGVFALVFVVFPFGFHGRLERSVWPWIASAAAPIGTFALTRDVVVNHGGWEHMGLLPLAFAVPSLTALWVAVRTMDKEVGCRTSALAWYGGVALFFVTLIFPMEFSRQYLSMSWALEGAALIWLYRRVPHPGLVWVGLGLLGVVFVRLGLNLQLIESYPRAARMIFNWHLATYGTAIASMLAAAKWLLSPHDKLIGINVRAILCALAGVLGFVWINLEITDIFTPLGERTLLIDLENASVGRRMTYSIAWAAYALLMIVVGFKWSSRGARYAGIALMVITIGKVFIRDLDGLDNLYRIGALGGVALMALAASFVYQRFFDRSKLKEDSTV